MLLDRYGRHQNLRSSRHINAFHGGSARPHFRTSPTEDTAPTDQSIGHEEDNHYVAPRLSQFCDTGEKGTINIEQHLNSIPLHSICKTFYETMLVARTLGVHFLWIDSLCIIQNDEEDWAREASKMAEAYQNAWLNIAATGAIDGTQGLFLDRMGVERLQTPHGEAVFQPAVDHPAFENDGAWDDKGTALLLLLKRGWVLQEQFFSTRVLHFTQQELL